MKIIDKNDDFDDLNYENSNLNKGFSFELDENKANFNLTSINHKKNDPKKNKIIVWDLFGGGQNSVFKALNDSSLNYDIYTFDVTEPTRKKHFWLDLSQKNIVTIFDSLIKSGKIKKPDIIISSTLCQSFSCVLNMKGGGTCFWKYNNDKTKLIFRTKAEFEKLKNGFTKRLDADTQLYIAKLGKKCIDNTIELIKYFKPRYWYIENPKTSLLWKYIILNRKDFYNESKCFLNEASYGKYGYMTTKATFFMSNVKMDLLKGKIEPPYVVKEINGIKYYVLKDDPNTKVPKSLDSRMIGFSSINKMIKARNVKSGMGGMDFVMKQQKVITNKNKKTPIQLSEASPASHIPSKLIKDIFRNFKF